MKGFLFVCALVACFLSYVTDASAQRSVVRVNGPGIGNRSSVRVNGFSGANVNVNGFHRGANVNVNGFGHSHGVRVNSFHGHHVNNFGAFAVTRPHFSAFSYAPPVAVQAFGVPVISSYGLAPVGIQSYGYQVQSVGFANPGCGRLLLGY